MDVRKSQHNRKDAVTHATLVETKSLVNAVQKAVRMSATLVSAQRTVSVAVRMNHVVVTNNTARRNNVAANRNVVKRNVVVVNHNVAANHNVAVNNSAVVNKAVGSVVKNLAVRCTIVNVSANQNVIAICETNVVAVALYLFRTVVVFPVHIHTEKNAVLSLLESFAIHLRWK